MTPLCRIKLLHTLVWAFFVALIGHVWYAGITGHITVLTWIAISLVFLEGAVLLLSGGTCPLTHWARRYSDSTRHNFDIFLPEFIARYNQHIFTSLFLLGMALVLWRHWAGV